MKQIEKHAMFGGEQSVWEHSSTTLNCTMRFGIFLPPQVETEKCPVLYWLSGLTCTEQNFITKACAQRFAAKHGIILVVPDTSPRGDFVADNESYDLGQGASFYINATQSPWSEHFQMFDYVTQELPSLIEATFPTNNKRSISGHSMGGHGALICAAKKPGFYASASAFSPICAPSQVPWGEKAFSHYLGDEKEAWRAWDSCALLEQSEANLTLLVDQGEADEFREPQLKPKLLVQAAEAGGHNLNLRMHAGYDHSYYFIASFIEDHMLFHADALK